VMSATASATVASLSGKAPATFSAPSLSVCGSDGVEPLLAASSAEGGGPGTEAGISVTHSNCSGLSAMGENSAQRS
jgi:hypothetical protein